MKMNLTGISLLALSLGLGAPALAQEPPAEPAEPGVTAPAEPAEPAAPLEAELTEEQLRTFAEAVLQVQEVAQQYGPQIEAAETEEEQQALREEALDEAVAAVEDAGLEVAEYEAIAVAVQEDPQVAQQVAMYLREAMGAPPAPAEPAPPAPPAQ